MGKTFLIFRHELANAVRTAGFVVLTLAVPVVALLGIGIYSRLNQPTTPPPASTVTIGYVDQAGVIGGYAQQGGVTFRVYPAPSDATAALVRGDAAAYVVVPPRYVANGIVELFTLQGRASIPDQATEAIQAFLVDNLLAGKVPEATVARVRNPVTLVPTVLTDSGAATTQQGGTGSFVVPLALAILLIFSLALSLTAMLYTLGDEKENRLLEILVSSLSARQLLAGKVLATVTAGLIQVVVWLVSMPIIVRAGSSVIGGFFASIQAPTGLLILSGAYFVLAYLLFAVIMACAGAISPNAREGGQLASVFMLCMVAPLWFASLIYLYPDSLVVSALSIFPLTSAVVMTIRSSLTDVPAWQVALSLSLLIGSCVGGLLLAARLFQTYLLSYGRRPQLREVLRSLRA